nr:hypothetical protein Itr_chr05CG12260 [Ipomoea trifida]
MSLRDGRERGEVPEVAQGGVFLSTSDTCVVRADATATGLDDKYELSCTLPLLLPSDNSSKWSWLFTSIVCFILLCSFCISRRDVDPFAIFAPPQAGPSTFGDIGGGTSTLGTSSRAPLKNIESPPFLFFFLFTTGDAFVPFGEQLRPFFKQKGDSFASWSFAGLAAPSKCLSSYQLHENYQYNYNNNNEKRW